MTYFRAILSLPILLIVFMEALTSCQPKKREVVFNPFEGEPTFQVSIRNLARLHDLDPGSRGKLLSDSGYKPMVAIEDSLKDTTYYSDGEVTLVWKGNEFVQVTAFTSTTWSKRCNQLMQSEIKRLEEESRLKKIEKTEKETYLLKRRKKPDYYIIVRNNDLFLRELISKKNKPKKTK